MNVLRFFWVVPVAVAAIPAAALARDCNEVKAEIDAKIKAKGALKYVLQIVNGRDVKQGQIVGNCAVGAKKIVYFREPTSESASKPHSTSAKQAQPLSPEPATPILTGSNRSEPVD